MSRYVQNLDTVRRTLVLIDKETESKLTITQHMSEAFFEKLGENDDTDELVEFANDLANDLTTGVLALELFGDSEIYFDDTKFPRLAGGVFLRNCKINNPDLFNCRLANVDAVNPEKFHVMYSTVEDFDWAYVAPITISHCFTNKGYDTVIKGAGPNNNEWLMNKDVTGTMW